MIKKFKFLTLMLTAVFAVTTFASCSNNDDDDDDDGVKSGYVTSWICDDGLVNKIYFYSDNTYIITEELPGSGYFEICHYGNYTGDTTKSGQTITLTPTKPGDGTSTISQWLRKGIKFSKAVYIIDPVGTKMEKKDGSFEKEEAFGIESASMPYTFTKQ